MIPANPEKMAFFESVGWRCWYCGQQIYPYGIDGVTLANEACAVIDHQESLGRGGSNRAENKVASCRKCNCQKQSKSVEEYRVWLMRRASLDQTIVEKIETLIPLIHQSDLKQGLLQYAEQLKTSIPRVVFYGEKTGQSHE